MKFISDNVKTGFFKVSSIFCLNEPIVSEVAINVWLRQYNQIRPHHKLNMRPPVPETLLKKPKINERI